MNPALGTPVQLPVGGGLAVYAGPDSPLNKLIGLGFDGPVEEQALARAEAVFAERGAQLQAEVSTLADVGLHGLLCARGYVASGFENVLGYPLTLPASAPASEISVTRVAPDEHAAFAELMVTAVETPDVGGVGGDATPPSELIRHWVLAMLRSPGVSGYLARIRGELAGAASMRLDDALAQFTGAATLPAFRRRGVQSALLRARLADAARAGCDVAVVTTQPASKSQHNV
ncbi:MAG: GNAT family N-acetyltransferase, partial [Polyangiaceae bacterium]